MQKLLTAFLAFTLLFSAFAVAATSLEETLLNDLGSFSYETRFNAAQGLGAIARGQDSRQSSLSPDVIPKLKVLLTFGKTHEQKLGAAAALGEISDPSTFDFMKKRAKHYAKLKQVDLAMSLVHSARERDTQTTAPQTYALPYPQGATQNCPPVFHSIAD